MQAALVGVGLYSLWIRKPSNSPDAPAADQSNQVSLPR